MKKPRTFWILHFENPAFTTLCSTREAAENMASGWLTRCQYQIIHVKEITDAKDRKTKAPRKARTARKVQAVAGKRAQEAKEVRKKEGGE